jgi:hypothetical protein
MDQTRSAEALISICVSIRCIDEGYQTSGSPMVFDSLRPRADNADPVSLTTDDSRAVGRVRRPDQIDPSETSMTAGFRDRRRTKATCGSPYRYSCLPWSRRSSLLRRQGASVPSGGRHSLYLSLGPVTSASDHSPTTKAMTVPSLPLCQCDVRHLTSTI